MVDNSLIWYDTEITIGLPYDAFLSVHDIADALTKLDADLSTVYTLEATQTRFEDGRDIAIYHIKPNTVYLCTINNKVINVLQYTPN